MLSFTAPVLGQEAICPDGLGRVIAYDNKFPKQWIQIRTYVNDRSCKWSFEKITLIKLKSDADEELLREAVAVIVKLKEYHTRVAMTEDLHELIDSEYQRFQKSEL